MFLSLSHAYNHAQDLRKSPQVTGALSLVGCVKSDIFKFKLNSGFIKKYKGREMEREESEEKRNEGIICSHSLAFVDEFFTVQRTYHRGSHNFPTIKYLILVYKN